MNPQRPALWWSIPASQFAADALAWGLYPHLYFAQLLMWAVPLLGPALRRAVQRFPQRLMVPARPGAGGRHRAHPRIRRQPPL